MNVLVAIFGVIIYPLSQFTFNLDLLTSLYKIKSNFMEPIHKNYNQKVDYTFPIELNFRKKFKLFCISRTPFSCCFSKSDPQNIRLKNLMVNGMAQL